MEAMNLSVVNEPEKIEPEHAEPVFPSDFEYHPIIRKFKPDSSQNVGIQYFQEWKEVNHFNPEAASIDKHSVEYIHWRVFNILLAHTFYLEYRDPTDVYQILGKEVPAYKECQEFRPGYGYGTSSRLIELLNRVDSIAIELEEEGSFGADPWLEAQDYCYPIQYISKVCDISQTRCTVYCVNDIYAGADILDYRQSRVYPLVFENNDWYVDSLNVLNHIMPSIEEKLR